MKTATRTQEGFLDTDQIIADVNALGAQGYESLMIVLRRAFTQAAFGKGKERHAQDMPFEDQPMQKLIALYGPGFALGQAAKKAQESQRLPKDRAIAELLGAINYLAGAIIALELHPEHGANDNAAPVAANDNVPGRCPCQQLPAGMCPNGAGCGGHG